MNLSVGIVGLPNVGKSTLFNALLKKQSSFAEASAGQAGLGGVARVGNFPFTTIEPNVGVVPVPDERLNKLAEITKVGEGMVSLPPIIPATVKFVDIAGLVKGANEGAGLGNKFLSHIREVSIIVHVVRAFEDPNIIKEGSVDPKSDYQTVSTELILADLQTLERLKSGSHKKPSILDSIEGKRQEVVGKLKSNLNKGIPAREIILTDEEQEFAKTLFLLSGKPEITVLNVAENDYSEKQFEKIYSRYIGISAVKRGDSIIVCAKIEAELSELSHEEQKQYLSDLGIDQSGLERLIRKAYETLGLVSFLTCGEKEVRAWTVQKGMKAVDAAGVIHTDLTNKFIKAEVVSYNDFVQNKGWKGSKERGFARLEGRDYIIGDGDVVEFKIGS